MLRAPSKTMENELPISKSLYHEDGFRGECNICGELTTNSCDACPKWLCGSSRCMVQHGKDETEGWS